MATGVAKLTEVEVQGKKFMVDMAGAKVIDQFKVGDPIKVLVKKYNDEFDAYYGMVIGFDNFENLPTIVIAYFEAKYGGEGELKIVHLNDQAKGIEICHTTPAEAALNPQAVLDKINSTISDHRNKIRELRNKKEFFLNGFAKVFGINVDELNDEEDYELRKDK